MSTTANTDAFEWRNVFYPPGKDPRFLGRPAHSNSFLHWFSSFFCETTHTHGWFPETSISTRLSCSSYQIFAGSALCVLIKGFISLDLTTLCHLRKWPEIGTKEEWLLQ
jgi:hypothetical protein